MSKITNFFREHKFLFFLYSTCLLISIIVVIRFAGEILVSPTVDLLAWDQAARADDAVRLAKEVYFLRFDKFIFHVLSLNWWPPLLPFVIFPFVLVFGPSILAVLIPSFIAYPMAIMSILFLYQNLYEDQIEKHVLEYSLLFSLALTSPHLLISSSLVMLEIFGVLLTYLGVGFYLRARRDNNLSFYRVCALLGFLLWTLKYYYGFFFTLVVLLFELLRSPGPVRRLFRPSRIVRFLGKPVFLPAFFLLFLIVLIVLTQGKTVDFLGLRMSFTNPYNLVMYLYLYLFIVFLLMIRKNWAGLKDRLEFGQRELLLWGALPAAAFLALPDKLKAIMKTFEVMNSADSGISWESFLYYFKSMVKDYSWISLVGMMAIFLLFFGLARIKKSPLGIKLLYVYFFFGVAFVSLASGQRESRFVANFVPALWIIAVWVIGSLLRPWPQKVKVALAAGVFLGSLCSGLFFPVISNLAKLQPQARHAEVYRNLLDPVVQRSRDAHNILILGAADLGFHPLLKWKLECSHFKQKDFRVEFDNIRKEKIREARFDLVIIFIVEKGAGRPLLEELSGAFLDSGNFRLSSEEFFEEPERLRTQFMEKL